MSEILKRTSFSLLRTNPKLTTNIKIVADSKDKIYLESIDADPLLSKSIYKGYQISSSGSYSFDLKRFFSQSGNVMPKNIAYMLFEEDASLDIKDRYKNQFDFTYGYGMYPKNSRIYTEEFSLFAPIWLEADNIPDYFVIFKMDDPASVNINDPSVISAVGATGNFDTAVILDYLVKDPSLFFDNFVEKAKIIKTFDLTDKSSIGRYIRNHINDPRFPESAIYANLQKGNLTNWQGISYVNGGFCKITQDIYKDYVLADKTITEADDFLTAGFLQNGVVCANIMNLEFLFDDPEQEKYKFSRYFGLYVNAIELGKFYLDSNRLYLDKDQESTQIPRPIDSTIGAPTNTNSQPQENVNGIKVYPHVGLTAGATAPYSGRLITFEEIQNPRFAYVKDRESNFYSIDSSVNWASVTTYPATGPTSNPYSVTDTNYLRIKNKKVDWKTFTGFDAPFQYIPSLKTDKRGRAIASFEVIGDLTVGDEIRVKYVDWNDPSAASLINYFTIEASNTLPAGTINGLAFSMSGTKKQIASAISLAINNIQNYIGEYQIFSSISKDSTVYIFARVDSSNWNKLKFSLFSNSYSFPYAPFNKYVSATQTTYQPSPISASPIEFGWYYEDNFAGGNNNPNSRIIIEKEYVTEFRDDNDLIYVKTVDGYDTTGSYGLYTDGPVLNSVGEIIDFTDIDKYYVVNLSNTTKSVDFGSSKKIGLYKYAKNSNGYLSILPIRDFDFDFHSDEYNKSADSNVTSLYDWYTNSSYWTDTQPYFDPSLIGSTGLNIIDNLVGPTSAFVTNGGFQTLVGLVDEIGDSETAMVNEYSRLKENDLPDLALSSRVVPFINKWVYDNESVDVRENNYRLTSDQAFGYANYSPSFDEYSSSTKLFTQEWLYLQKYPPYMTFDEKLDSYSYFDEDLYFPNLPVVGASGSTAYFSGLTGATGASANLLSVNENYFVSYFTRETIGGSAINRDFKYSIFGYGDDVRFSETLFRGIKVLIKDRSEFSHINYNTESLRFLTNSKYNGYKFSGVLTYSNSGTNITFIKNDYWKTVSLIVQADLGDALLQYWDRDPVSGLTGASHSFVDRSSLYTLQNKYTLSPGGTFVYEDVVLSGSIGSNVSGNFIFQDNPGLGFTVYGGTDLIGNQSRFNAEVTLNESGAYSQIRVYDPNNPVSDYTFSQITSVRANSFTCNIIDGPGFGTILTGSGYSVGSTNTGPYPPGWGSLIYNTYVSAFLTNPIYVGGGYNAYSRILEEISFAAIANSINSGNPDIKYITVKENGAVVENEYAIELAQPDYPFKASYLRVDPLKKKPVDLQNSADIIGYEIGAETSMTLSQIARNRGGFNPKVRDIMKFVDTDDIKNEGLSYYNIQILSDIGYLKDYNIGLIKNVHFNKVNVENPNVILRATTGKERSIYPLIGEIAIDYADVFAFRSNWDPFYFYKYARRNIRTTVMGTREPKEEKSFFGSKVIAIPNNIRLETFPSGVQDETRLPNKNEFVNSGKSIAKVLTETRKDTTLTARIFTTIALQDYLIADGFGSEFSKYINPNYSFGNPDLDDDVKLYIQENIVERYIIKEIILWEKFWRKGSPLPQIQTGLTDEQKIQAGYVKSKSFRATPLSTGNLNFDLIYTIPSDKNSSIAFTVVLEKK
jgi:hypothetical protein